MSYTQLEQWVLEHFVGCDYGAVSVDRIQIEEQEQKKPQGEMDDIPF